MRQTSYKTAALALSSLLMATFLLADGGSLQFRKQMGSLIITVFAAPVPLRVGPADLSVMVQRAKDNTAVLDAVVKLHLLKSTRDNVLELMMPATRAQATNKMLYAAQMKVPSSGEWRLEAQVTAEGATADVSGNVTVLEAEPPAMAHWPYFALIPAAILAFALNQWLKSKRGIKRR